ncbi:MAG TPA: PP2C family serine/threonine-protein phosphatase [Blastocatellia bacterium]
MHNVLVSVFARTDIGRRREGNEDAFLIADLTTGKVGLGPDMITHPVGERGSLLIVSDGMGGAVAGEIASEIAVKAIRQSLLELPPDIVEPQRLKIATEIANESIWNEAQRNASLTGMGATVTAVLVRGCQASIAQVGDSRAYLIRGDRIKQITKDQSYAQMLVDSGAIKPEQIESVPQNVIMQALGTQPAVHVALTSVELHRNDHLVLCSDGLSGKIKAEEMRRVVQECSDLMTACRILVDLANERGGEDNITVVLAHFDGVGLEAADQNATITDSFKALDEEMQREQRQNERPDSGTHELVSSGPPPRSDYTTMHLTSVAPAERAGAQAPPAEAPPAEKAEKAESRVESFQEPRRDAPQPPPARRVPRPTTSLAPGDIPSFDGQQQAERARSEPLVARKATSPTTMIILVLVLLLLLAAAYLIYRVI